MKLNVSLDQDSPIQVLMLKCLAEQGSLCGLKDFCFYSCTAVKKRDAESLDPESIITNNFQVREPQDYSLEEKNRNRERDKSAVVLRDNPFPDAISFEKEVSFSFFMD
jgi:hypothetical protein